MDQIFTLKQIFEKTWEYAKDLFACFVDLEKAFDRVPRDKLWKVLREYGVDGQLLRAIKSFYCRPEDCVRVNGKQSKPFHVGVGLRQGCVLSPLLFIVYMNWIDKCMNWINAFFFALHLILDRKIGLILGETIFYSDLCSQIF